MISGSIVNMTDHNLETYTNAEAIAISQDPLGHQGIRLFGGPLVDVGSSGPNGAVNICGRRLSGGAAALAFLNTGKGAVDLTCDHDCLSALGLDPTAELAVRDVWA